jgi:hypothetical protein
MVVAAVGAIAREIYKSRDTGDEGPGAVSDYTRVLPVGHKAGLPMTAEQVRGKDDVLPPIVAPVADPDPKLTTVAATTSAASGTAVTGRTLLAPGGYGGYGATRRRLLG